MLSGFLGGMVTAGFLVAGLFFLRFWRRTADRLFLAFAVAFWLLAVNECLVVFAEIPREGHSWIYLLRLAAFALLIVAIVGKNIRLNRFP
jgi:uncharacterized protein DUF5985